MDKTRTSRKLQNGSSKDAMQQQKDTHLHGNLTNLIK